MNVKFLNPFVDAVTQVLQSECQINVKRGDLTLQKSSLTTDDVTVLISMVGQIQGVVLYGLSEKTSLGLVSRMMEQQFTTFDSLAQSGVAELGNVISGQATIRLSKAGFTSNISPPTLIQGQGISISTLDFSRIVVPLNTDLGDLIVHLALREAPPGAQNTSFVPVKLPEQVNGNGV